MVLLILLFVGLWAGFQVGKLYFDHASLEKEVKTLALNAMVSSRSSNLKERIERALDFYPTQYDPEHISITTGQEGTRMYIRIPYRRHLNFVVFKHYMWFEVDIMQDAPRRGGVIGRTKQRVEDSYRASERRYQEGVKKALSQ